MSVFNKFRDFCRKKGVSNRDIPVLADIVSKILVEKLDELKKELSNKSVMFVDNGESVDHLAVKTADIIDVIEDHKFRSKEIMYEKN